MRKLFAEPAPQPEKKGNSKNEGKDRAEDRNTGKKTQVFRSMSRNFERRVKSELFLEDSLPWHSSPARRITVFLSAMLTRSPIYGLSSNNNRWNMSVYPPSLWP